MVGYLSRVTSDEKADEKCGQGGEDRPEGEIPEDAQDAAHNAVVLEAVARMAYRTLTLRAHAAGVSQALLDQHYFRKHGSKATYGQGG